MTGQQQAERLAYIDWLRVFIISLVVAHHAGMAYATLGEAWPVRDVERTALLTPFFGVNAAFGMGLLLFIAGYFVPGSLARKGAARFIIERAIRLGLPLVVFGFGVFALTGYWTSSGEQGFWAYYRNQYIGEWKVEFAHLWFVLHLLLYSIVYALLSKAYPTLARQVDGKPAGHGALLGLVLVITIAGGVARLAFPQDVWVKLLWTIPAEPAHLPQYVAMFGAGTIAGRGQWFTSFSPSVGKTWLRIGLLAAALVYVAVYLDILGGLRVIDNPLIAMTFPLWEAVLCVGLGIGITAHARYHWDRSTAWLPTLAGATYGVYLVHVFVVVAFNVALLNMALPALLKFLLVTVLSLMTTFPAVILLRKLPLASRVI